jgi:hypothetical protein
VTGVTPEVSIVVPAYRNADGLSELAQRMTVQDAAEPAYELIPIDDGNPVAPMADHLFKDSYFHAVK